MFPFVEDILTVDESATTLETYPNIYGFWKIFTLNPLLRICKYDESQFFKKHYDSGYHPIPYKQHSFKTCMLYLNEDFEGGETVFYNDDSSDEIARFKPLTGSCLIFNQQIFHEGLPVESNNKYFVRTDIVYKKMKMKL